MPRTMRRNGQIRQSGFVQTDCDLECTPVNTSTISKHERDAFNLQTKYQHCEHTGVGHIALAVLYSLDLYFCFYFPETRPACTNRQQSARHARVGTSVDSKCCIADLCASVEVLKERTLAECKLASNLRGKAHQINQFV